jgi:DNA-binding LacI/PurR family transcriptional regulator
VSRIASIPWTTRTHRRVALKLDDLRSAGHITDGQVLPSERELSELCGVSRPTLRQVMTQLEAHGLVRSMARRGRVLVPEPGEDQDAAGRSLSQMIVLVTDVTRPKQVAAAQPAPTGYTEQLMASVNRAAVAGNFDLIVLRLESAVTSLPALVREGIAGVVIASTLQSRGAREERIAQAAIDLGVPVAVYGYPPVDADAQPRPWDTVSSDHRRGGRLTTDWLLAHHGCRRPLPYRRVKRAGQTDGQTPRWWQIRLEGYRDAMQAQGLDPLDPLEIDAVWGDEAHGRQGLERDARYLAGFLAPILHAEDAPDGIVAASDYCAAVARLALDYALPPGHTPPPVTGYDNAWSHLRSLDLTDTPPVVTVDKDFNAVGKALVETLHDRLTGQADRAPQHHAVPPVLVQPELDLGLGRNVPPPATVST